MYCKICGQDGPDDNRCCTYCGSPLDPNAVIPNDDIKSENDDTIEETIDNAIVYMPKREVYLPPLRWLILGIFVVILLILLCFSGFRKFVFRQFLPPATLLKKVYSQSIEDICSQLQPADMLRAGDAIAAQYEINIKNGDQTLQILADSLDTDAQNIRGLSNIDVNCDIAYDCNMLNAIYQFSVCDQDIISLEQQIDITSAKQWIVIPELSNQAFISVFSDGEQLHNIFAPELPQIFSIEPDVLNNLSSHYVHMLIDGFENFNKYTHEVTSNGLSQRLTIVEATISTRQLYVTFAEMLEDASTNPDVARILYDMQAQTGELYYDEFISSLNEQIIKFYNASQQLDTYSTFTVYTYLNHNHEIVGVQIEYLENGKLYPLCSWKVVANGMRFSTEMSFWNGVFIQGTGNFGNTIGGTFQIYQNQQAICTINLKDFKYNPNFVCGSIEIIPDEEIVEHFVNEIGAYETYLKLNRMPYLYFELIINWNDTNKDISLNAYSSEELLTGIKIMAKIKDSATIQTNELTGELDFETWRSMLDESLLKDLENRLEGAGIIYDLSQQNREEPINE